MRCSSLGVAKAKLVLRRSAPSVSLYSSICVHLMFLALGITFRPLGQQLSYSCSVFVTGFVVTLISATDQTDVRECREMQKDDVYFNSVTYGLLDLRRRCLDSSIN